MDLLLYEKEYNYLINTVNITIDHLESIVKLIKNRSEYKKITESSFEENLKKATKLNVNKLAIYHETNRLRRNLRELKNVTRKIYHLLGQELLSPGGLSSLHFNEYYAIENIFFKLYLYSQNSENYSYKRLVFFTIDILKALQTIYENIFE